MPSPGSSDAHMRPSTDDDVCPKGSTCKLTFFWLLLLLDLGVTITLLTPIIPWVQKADGWTHHYTMYSSLWDLALLGVVRLLCAAVALLVSYCLKPRPKYTFPLTHSNGEKKSNEELEQEALEEPFGRWFGRYLCRPAFLAETLALLTQIACIAKCLLRMNIEIGTLADAESLHPLIWVTFLLTAVFSMLEACFLDNVCQMASHKGQKGSEDGLLRRIGSSLSVPLLSEQEETEESQDEENPEDVRRVSDISADASHKATLSDLWSTISPDLHLVALAFVFLIMAAVAQILVPHYLSAILDAITDAFTNKEQHSKIPMSQVPGFIKNSGLLVAASILAGIFAGLRGSIFTVVGGRVNVRLRIQLMDSLLAQDIGFFDTTKTGDITSRLSSDTTLVGDQVTLNVNVFLRSLVQAIGVLIFMFMLSWQLSILAFISVPLITVLSKWYGNYVRSLTKLMQKKLADGNSVSEAALGSMPTVRAFDAAESELQEFQSHMEKYLGLNMRSAFAYCGYAAFTTAVPQLVFAIVVFYGGMLVRNGDLTSGKLVAFLFYLQSLSDAFSSIGYIFSSLTQAIGAADKVFELLHRKPKYRTPSNHRHRRSDRSHNHRMLGVQTLKTREHRTRGIRLNRPSGDIKLRDVDLYYPARPQRQVLNKLSLDIEAGSIVALVGQSGGGKSSVMSLIQHLYEPSGGKVFLDDNEVHEIRPDSLSRVISIVSQEPTLFARSIKRNIIYGLEGTENEPSDEEILQAARLANADEFIQTMPQKYETDVGERGVQLSGGQKQRIAIARALIRKPKVLLLDEATSALDANSELAVQKAIDDMIARGKEESDSSAMTVLIVAHRLSTVRNADKIFVIEDGRVVEQGNHDDLLRDPHGAYTSLIKGQMQAQHALDELHSDFQPSSQGRARSPSRRIQPVERNAAQLASLERIRQRKRQERLERTSSPRTPGSRRTNNSFSSGSTPGSVGSRSSYSIRSYRTPNGANNYS